jgi:nitrogen fixation/metabolism regulation signal transduction histidine kinase
MEQSLTQSSGKLSTKDAATARLLKFAPWLAVVIVTIPVPLFFLILFLTSAATDTAAVFLLLTGLSLALGFGLGLMIAAILLIYRRRWLSKLRDRLASDGITASEVVWFRSELTSAERNALKEIQQSNPLLADAYLETLASRLTASRIINRSKKELLRVERRLNRARTLGTPESKALEQDLNEDHERVKHLLAQANDHLAKARTRLQVIEATSSRKLNQTDTDLMMQRLGSAQDQLPLVLEIAQLEQQMLRESNAPPLPNDGVTQGS